MSDKKVTRLADLGASDYSASRPRLAYDTLEDAFPNVDPGHRAFGERVLVQLKTASSKTKGGIELVKETTDTESDNCQVARVVDIGAVAFKNRETLVPWPEGAWVTVGMYVRVPKYGGDRFYVPIPGKNEKAVFVFFRDGDMIGEVTGDPLSVVAYI